MDFFPRFGGIAILFIDADGVVDIDLNGTRRDVACIDFSRICDGLGGLGRGFLRWRRSRNRIAMHNRIIGQTTSFDRRLIGFEGFDDFGIRNTRSVYPVTCIIARFARVFAGDVIVVNRAGFNANRSPFLGNGSCCVVD